MADFNVLSDHVYVDIYYEMWRGRVEARKDFQHFCRAAETYLKEHYNKVILKFHPRPYRYELNLTHVDHSDYSYRFGEMVFMDDLIIVSSALATPSQRRNGDSGQIQIREEDDPTLEILTKKAAEKLFGSLQEELEQMQSWEEE